MNDSYTDEAIRLLTETFLRHEQEMIRLGAFCNAVARGINFDSASDITVQCGAVSFTADWYGSYQSENHERVTFPVGLLVRGVDAVVALLKERQRQLEEEKKRHDAAERERAEREQYERLQQKYGPRA